VSWSHSHIKTLCSVREEGSKSFDFLMQSREGVIVSLFKLAHYNESRSKSMKDLKEMTEADARMKEIRELESLEEFYSTTAYNSHNHGAHHCIYGIRSISFGNIIGGDIGC
jgi:hypothetical protein